MSLADSIETIIHMEGKTKFAALNLPDEFVAPNYCGRSIVNIPATIVKILGGDIPTPALDADILGRFPNGVRRIVLVIADAMGYRNTVKTLDSSPHNGFHALLKSGATLAPITSIFPSTTTAALATFWSGYTPAEHGLMGMLLYLREVDALSYIPGFETLATDKLKPRKLVDAGIELENFLPVPSLPQILEKLGVPTYNFTPHSGVKTALSRVLHRGQKEIFGFIQSSDMWVMLRNVIEKRKDERAVFIAYWGAMDAIQHRYGASSEAFSAEANNFACSFEHEFLRKLSPAAREGALFILTADHGQIDLPTKYVVRTSDHPDLQSHLSHGTAGDSRAVYLYCRQGEKDLVREYVARNLAGKFFVLDSQVALDAGLFGLGTLAPETIYRIGDLLLIARGNYSLWDWKDDPTDLGGHGGLSAEEVFVPILLARLDA